MGRSQATRGHGSCPPRPPDSQHHHRVPEKTCWESPTVGPSVERSPLRVAPWLHSRPSESVGVRMVVLSQ